MSKAESWAIAAENNSLGGELGSPTRPNSIPNSEVLPLKRGKKANAIIRKSRIFSISDDENENINKLTKKLKYLDLIDDKRGRSGAVELAVNLARVALHSDNKWAMEVIKSYQQEEIERNKS